MNTVAPQSPRMKVLLVEDSPDDAALIEQALKEVDGARFDLTHVQRLKEAVQQFGLGSYDVVLLDLALPDSHGIETVTKLSAQAPNVPVVVLTGLTDEAMGLDAVRSGAQDYLVKGEVDGKTIARVMRYARERKWSEAQLRQAFDEMSRSRQELLHTVSELNKAHGDLKVVHLELIEAAKTELVGRLAGGIAHEVKSPLATLMIGVDYLLHHVAGDDENVRHILQNMNDAIKRADAIVSGLQQFAQPSDLEVKAENLGAIAEQALALVKHELGKHRITVDLEFAKDLPALWLDPNKIEQVFVNAFMNAIEAMPQQGTLTVRTLTKQLDADDVDALPKDKGPHFLVGQTVVVAQIDDSGPGIPEENLAKVFDPFFTTKPPGKGTGLGLTVARKIVELHGGRITVRNRDEGGTSVTILFKA